MALGVLVGALTVGSAGPHLIRGVGFGWEGVIAGASVSAVAGTLILGLFVGDGPFETAPARFSWGQIGSVVRNEGVRLSTYGYLGHMWELYAMWTWTAAFLAASATASGSGDGWVPSATFGVIAIGGGGAWIAGVLADRSGRTLVTGGSMAVSGTCALVTPLVFGLSPWVVVPVFLIWGVTVVSDSAQFSAMVTETAEDSYRGTALTLQTAIGFLLTLGDDTGRPGSGRSVGMALGISAAGTRACGGVLAMARLRQSVHAVKLAGGLG